MLINWNACLAYVVSRQCDDGGFCFYRALGVEESNALDAYSAVVALDRLKTDVPRREALVAWLKAVQKTNGDYPGLPTAWYALESLRILNENPTYSPRGFLETQQDQFIANLTTEKTLDGSNVMLSINRLANLLEHWDIPPRLEFKNAVHKRLQDLQGLRDGYGWPTENLCDTATAFEIQARFNWQEMSNGLAFAEACLDPQTGFRLVPNSSATSLTVLDAGLSIFQFCHQPLSEPFKSAAIRFIAVCQSANGGFGRTDGAIPTLTDTRLALKCLGSMQAFTP